MTEKFVEQLQHFFVILNDNGLNSTLKKFDYISEIIYLLTDRLRRKKPKQKRDAAEFNPRSLLHQSELTNDKSK